MLEPPPKILEVAGDAAPAGLPKRLLPGAALLVAPPNRPPLGLFAPGVGVAELLPKSPPAPGAVAPPPNRPPAADVFGWLAGVLPNKPPALGASAGVAAPNKDDVAAAGVDAPDPPPRLPKENVGVPAVAPNKPPGAAAGADVEGVVPGFEPVPKLKAMVSTRKSEGLKGLVRDGSKVDGI